MWHFNWNQFNGDRSIRNSNKWQTTESLKPNLAVSANAYSRASTTTSCFVGTALPFGRSENKHLPCTTTNKRVSYEKYVDKTTRTTYEHPFSSFSLINQDFRKQDKVPSLHFLLHRTARKLILSRSKLSWQNDRFTMHESSPMTKSINTSKQLAASRHIRRRKRLN